MHPEPLFTETPKILSPADPNKKMSKSLGEKHYINLFRGGRPGAQTDQIGRDRYRRYAGGRNEQRVCKTCSRLLRACQAQAAHEALMARLSSRYAPLQRT